MAYFLKLRKMIKKAPAVTKVLRYAAAFLRARVYRKATVYLSSKYKHLAEKYNNPASLPTETERKLFASEPYPVWVLWLQGEENMPEPVKMCYDSMLKNAGGHKVNLITKDNYAEFVDIPECISEKYGKGIISHNHFSDIMRVCLLSKFGGLWADATIYVSEKLPTFDEFSFWTGKWTDGCDYAKERKWTSFLLYCLPNSPFACFIRECFFKYYGEHDKTVSYFIIDIFISIAYNEISAVKDFMDSVPSTRRGMSDLYSMLNSEYNEEEYEALCKEICFHKLSYKDDFRKSAKDGKLTFYGYLMQKSLN